MHGILSSSPANQKSKVDFQWRISLPSTLRGLRKLLYHYRRGIRFILEVSNNIFCIFMQVIEKLEVIPEKCWTLTRHNAKEFVHLLILKKQLKFMLNFALSVGTICILIRCMSQSPVRHYMQIFVSLDWVNREISNIRFIYKFRLVIYTGKNNRFPFLDILGHLKNTLKNPKFGRVRQVPTRELGYANPRRSRRGFP